MREKRTALEHHGDIARARRLQGDILAAEENPARARLLEPGDRVLLVVEDDLTFAMTMLEMARASGFKGVVAMSGHQALELARNGFALALEESPARAGCVGIAGWLAQAVDKFIDYEVGIFANPVEDA